MDGICALSFPFPKRPRLIDQLKCSGKKKTLSVNVLPPLPSKVKCLHGLTVSTRIFYAPVSDARGFHDWLLSHISPPPPPSPLLRRLIGVHSNWYCSGPFPSLKLGSSAPSRLVLMVLFFIQRVLFHTSRPEPLPHHPS